MHQQLALMTALSDTTILKRATPASFFVYFRLFKQTLQFLQQIYVTKCPSSIRFWDLNPQPSGQSPPITNGPGLLPR